MESHIFKEDIFYRHFLKQTLTFTLIEYNQLKRKRKENVTATSDRTNKKK